MYCWWCWLCAAMACSAVLCGLPCEPLSPRLSVFWAGRYLGRGHCAITRPRVYGPKGAQGARN